MTDILERLHVTDRGLLEAHYMRAFNYIHGGIVDDDWENPIVQDGTRRVFSRVNTEIVLGHPKLPFLGPVLFVTRQALSQ